MKKLLLSVFVASSFAASAQVTVFEDGFETYDDFAIEGFGEWLTLDLDGQNVYGVNDGFDWENNGVPQAWIVFNPSATTPPVTNATDGVDGETENRNFDPHTGSKYAASWAAAGDETVTPNIAPQNNDLLISPVINLGTTNNELTFWIKSMSDSFDLEEYRVLVYEGTGTPTSLSEFTPISGLTALTAPYPNWELKTFSLNDYSNQAIRIAIRNVGDDHYMLMVDDFKVTSSNLSVSQAFSAKFATYPNPSTGIINLTNTEAIGVNSIEITDLNGRVVKNIGYSDAPADIQINISELSSGMYLMNINSAEGTAVKKIVKK